MVEARESTSSFEEGSTIWGTWVNVPNTLYHAVECNRSSTSSEGLFPVSYYDMLLGLALVKPGNPLNINKYVWTMDPWYGHTSLPPWIIHTLVCIIHDLPRKHGKAKCLSQFFTPADGENHAAQRMQRGTKRCEVLFLRKIESSLEMDLCLMMCESPNTNVHGVLTMLSLMKSGKFHAIIGTFNCACEQLPFYDHRPLHSMQLFFPCADALQFVDAILPLLHSCIMLGRCCTHNVICAVLQGNG